MYTPLYIKTNYSLLSSLISIPRLIAYAQEKHFSSLAICDSNLFGMMEFYHQCKDHNIHPIIGLEITLENGIVLLYAKNYSGYLTLAKLSTIQSSQRVTIEDIQNHHDSVIGIVPFPDQNTYSLLEPILETIYFSYANQQEEKEALLVTENIVYVRKNLYLYETEEEYLKYLWMIRDGKTIHDDVNYDTKGYALDTKDIYAYTSNRNLFTTNQISDVCQFEFPKPSLLLPIYQETNGLSSYEYLKNLSLKGLQKRFSGKVRESYVTRLNRELEIIEKMGFSNYFLVVYDFIRYAKKNKILVGPGRGSGAGSLVCYSLGITDIDPIQYDLLFERFLNPERVTMPDIDTDFPDIYRDQVIAYVIEKYGKKRVSGIVTFGTLAAKQALRDVGRVFLIPNYQIDIITKKIPAMTKQKLSNFYEQDSEFRSFIEHDSKLTAVYKIASFLEGFPRHTSSHAAGIVMSQKDLDEILPLTVSDGMYLTAFPHEYLEELGLLKMDFLGLTTLTTIMHIIEDIETGEKITLDFQQIPLEDSKVLELFQKADTLGIFQFESSGMRNFLRKLKPTSFEDIFAANALFRPGPSENIDSYIRRKRGEEAITYLDDSLIPILKSTYGIIVYQEQIMQIANVLAGYTYGEADLLRRAMSKKKVELLQKEEEKFLRQSVERGYSQETAQKVFDLILKFANYGFNRSHSVAYSITACKMAYLKVYYPLYFYSNLLSSVIGSESKTKEYILEVKSKNISILKPSINHSGNHYQVAKEGIYFPLSGIRNVGSITCHEIVSNRKEGYTDIFDFLNRVKELNRKVLESLILAGCFDEFGWTRKTYMNHLDAILNYSELVSTLDSDYVLKPEIEACEEYTNQELIAMEKELFGFYLSNHPVTFYKAQYSNMIDLNQVREYFNQIITTVVLVEKVKVIQTKRGEEMMFFDASDEYQKLDFTLFPKIYQQYPTIQVGDILKIEGRIERRYDTFQVVVNKIEKLN